jgi:hypothetical protein
MNGLTSGNPVQGPFEEHPGCHPTIRLDGGSAAESASARVAESAQCTNTTWRAIRARRTPPEKRAGPVRFQRLRRISRRATQVAGLQACPCQHCCSCSSSCPPRPRPSPSSHRSSCRHYHGRRDQRNTPPPACLALASQRCCSLVLALLVLGLSLSLLGQKQLRAVDIGGSLKTHCSHNTAACAVMAALAYNWSLSRNIARRETIVRLRHHATPRCHMRRRHVTCQPTANSQKPRVCVRACGCRRHGACLHYPMHLQLRTERTAVLALPLTPPPELAFAVVTAVGASAGALLKPVQI